MKVLVIVGAMLMALGCSNPEQEATELYDQAVAARARGQLGQTEEILGRVVNEFPGSEASVQAEQLLPDVEAESEEEALLVMTDIRRAQAEFMGRERRFAQTGEELVASSTLLTEVPSAATLGYRIRLRGTPAADRYTISAEPTTGVASKRSFFQDLDGVVRWSIGEPATAESAELE